MLLSIPSWRAVVPLVTIGVLLVLGSLFLVGRDVAFTRSEAEGEVVAVAETGALAIELVPEGELETYLAGLLEHPAIATATVYSSNGDRTTRTRPGRDQLSWPARIIPMPSEPVVGCRAAGLRTLCLEADMTYYQTRLAQVIAPHAVLLAALAVLLLVVMVLARGENTQRLRRLATIVHGATEENNYSLRAAEGKGSAGDLARSINHLLEQMQQRDLMLRRRTTELEAANRELEAFSYSVSHDLRSPLASVDGFTDALRESATERLDESEREYLKWIRDGVDQMKNLVAGLLQMSRLTRAEMNRGTVDLSAMAQSIARSLQQRDPDRSVEFVIEEGVVVDADERLLHAVLENLMSNAYKYSGKTAAPRIEIGTRSENGRRVYFVKDNGAGFDAGQAAKLFTPFQRLHSSSEFEGTGIGLATVKRIVERHGGAIWADGKSGEGATFSFTLGETPRPVASAESVELTEV